MDSIPRSGKSLGWRRKWQFAPVFLMGKFHGQRRVRHDWVYTHTHTHTHTHSRGRDNAIMCCAMPSRSVMSGSATPWTVALQALPSMEFSRQEYWSGLPFPSPGDLSRPRSLHLLHWQVDSLSLCPPPGDLPNPGLLLCRQIPYCPSLQGSPMPC